MIPQVTAAALVAENKQRAMPASVDSIPTSRQPGGPRLHGRPRRPPPGRHERQRWPNILGIELLVGAQGCDFHRPLTSSAPLERVRALLRADVPMLDEDRLMAPDMAAATRLVGVRRAAPRRRPCPISEYIA